MGDDDDDGQIFNYWNLNCLRARRSCGIKCLNSDRDNMQGDNKFRGHPLTSILRTDSWEIKVTNHL